MQSIFYRFVFILACCFFFTNAHAKNKKGSLYFYIGYNGSIYSKSDIHVRDNVNYDFTLSKVKSSNVPIKKAIDLFSFNAPYNYRVGYNINNKFSVSVGLDHMKYVTIKNQDVEINGYIKPTASTAYAGEYNKSTIKLDPAFFYMEHTDGLNYISAEFDYTPYKSKFYKNILGIDLTIGAGIGFLVPRTEDYLFTEGANHPYHLAGFGTGIHFYPKIYITKYFFLQSTAKFGFIDMPDIIVNTHLDTHEKASQHFIFFQWNLALGVNIPLEKSDRTKYRKSKLKDN